MLAYPQFYRLLLIWQKSPPRSGLLLAGWWSSRKNSLRKLSGKAEIVNRRSGEVEDRRTRLSKRERAVLTAIADGLSNKEIARRLRISFHAVKFHVASILEKLEVDTRTEAVIKAAQLGPVML